jgi:uncharacterized membrane protein YeiH
MTDTGSRVTITRLMKGRPAVGLTMPRSDGTEAIVRTLVLTLDLFGTFVFALSGAMAGIRRRLDLFGVLVLSFAATAGGIVRDLMIGAVPPASVAEWRYIVVPVFAGLAMFWWHPMIR